MEWRARQRAPLFSRHPARRNDRPHADTLYEGQSWVAWDQLRLFIAKTGVDDLLGGANPRGDDWWKLAVRVHGPEPVLLGQYGQTALAVATLRGKWPAVDLFWSGLPDWWHYAVNGMCRIYRRHHWSKASRRRLDATVIVAIKKLTSLCLHSVNITRVYCISK